MVNSRNIQDGSVRAPGCSPPLGGYILKRSGPCGWLCQPAPAQSTMSPWLTWHSQTSLWPSTCSSRITKRTGAPFPPRRTASVNLVWKCATLGLQSSRTSETCGGPSPTSTWRYSRLLIQEQGRSPTTTFSTSTCVGTSPTLSPSMRTRFLPAYLLLKKGQHSHLQIAPLSDRVHSPLVRPQHLKQHQKAWSYLLQWIFESPVSISRTASHLIQMTKPARTRSTTPRML
mmetsp:Transcript_80013/g.208670  ORF Transcript_80013/g.208670 Transcript_80013/m.208670 type:complete len:229 (-) Transcript_80013:154-840(-)